MPVLPGRRAGSLRRVWRQGLIIAWAMTSPPIPADEFINPDDPSITLTGAWQRDGAAMMTPYPGSGIRFRLAGQARLRLEASADSVKVRISSGRGTEFSGVWSNHVYELDAGDEPANFDVTFVAASEEGFYQTNASRLLFGGIELQAGAELNAQNPPSTSLRLAFIGDSITAGAVIHGREGEWHKNSDASSAFPFLLAQQLDAGYSQRGFPGAQLHELISVAPFFCEDVPLDPAAPYGWVIVNAGANDRRLAPHEYANKMKQLVERIRASYPGARVLLLNFFRMTPARLPDLQKVARDFPDGEVMCFDARPYLVDYTDGHVHPGPESNRRLAAALADYFTNLPLASPGATGATKAE